MMRDTRLKALAENLITYSTELKPGEKILIDAIGACEDLALELIEKAYAVGAVPFLHLENPRLEAALTQEAPDIHFTMRREWEEARMSQMDAYVGIRATDNPYTAKYVPNERQEQKNKLLWAPVHSKIRVPKTKWVILRYPNDSMAQQAEMPTDVFADYYFRVCNLDYAEMSKNMEPLVELMNKTDRVELKSPGTDISFSIKDIPAIKCDGQRNIPDGEVYTAPVRDSINGVISYNAPSPNQGFIFKDIVLTFKNGKIVDAKANDTERINALLDTDEGARYVGEFAIGLNPEVKDPMGDILFDEKIAGSIHLTPGACYDEAPNGNQSATHWDLVLIQTPAYGGGEIYFDGKLIRKDGLFVLDELKPLNP